MHSCKRGGARVYTGPTPFAIHPLAASLARARREAARTGVDPKEEEEHAEVLSRNDPHRRSGRPRRGRQDHARRSAAAPRGRDQRAGSVERGTTVCDFDPLEKSYQHSLNASVVHLDTAETRIHIIDTPGLPDFVGRAIGALPAVETAAVVVNAQNGIEMITSRMMQWAAKRNLCRMIIVNKIDAENVDLPGLVAQIQSTFGKECLPINLPAGGGKRVVDCFFNPSGEADFSSVEEAHQALIDQVVEVDEALMAKYLEQGEVSPAELHAPFEQALREGHLDPDLLRLGAQRRRRRRAPRHLREAPAESRPKAIRPQFLKGEGADAQPIKCEPDPAKHVLAHVFKVMIDPFVGKVGVFRVHQGTISQRHAALHRRRPQAVQGRPPVPAAGQGIRRDRRARARRHRRGRQGRRDPLRRGAARFSNT